MATWTLTINNESIEVPSDYVLVRRDVFDDIAKAFAYIDRTITEHGVKPERRKDRELINARAEARDDVRYCQNAAKNEGTTQITYAKMEERSE